MSISFLILVPAISHILFSWMGFDITDNGYILSYTRMILDGRLPYHDFTYLCPIGSLLVHIPSVLFGGDYTFWISRFFVWFQFACIAWCWVSAIGRLLKIDFSILEKISCAFIAFVLSVHDFPIMAWYTIDGLFFISIGLVLCLRESQTSKLIGYAAIGISYLCKQTFLPVALMSIIILGDYKRIRLWLAIAAPGVIFLIYLILAGILKDAIMQIISRAGTISVATKYFNQRSVPSGILWGYLAMYLLYARLKIGVLANKTNLQKWLGMSMLYILPLAALIALCTNKRVVSLSFILFGAVAGATLYFTMEGKKQIRHLQAGALVLLTAWCMSLSIIYCFPVLVDGPMAVLLIGYGYLSCQPIDKNSRCKTPTLFLTVILVVVAIFTFVIVRREYSIYGDRPCASNRLLNGVLTGARLIKTNENTYQFLVDLQQAVEKTKMQDFIIIPEDVSAYWVKARQKINLLPVDRLTSGRIRLSDRYFEGLTGRRIEGLNARRGDIVIIVQKVKIDLLYKGFSPLTNNNAALLYVRGHFTKIDETRFFELYK